MKTGGNSIINGFNAGPEQMVFTYTLKSGFINPYAGFSIRGDSWLNLEPFYTLKIKIGASHARFVRVFLFTKMPGYTIDNNFTTYLHLQKEIAVRNDSLQYTVRFADLYTPEWWYEQALSESDPRLIRDFSNVFSVSIQSGIIQPVDIVDTITLEEISFYKSNRITNMVMVLLLLFYSGMLLLFFRLKRYRRKLAGRINKVVLACRDITLDDGFDEEAQKIITYIGENYSSHDLSVDSMSRICGIPAVRIPQCLKKHFGLSFPQYLNAIRLAEAGRLLKETDIMIAEIALRVGFNSIPHFNCVFKDNMKISPKDFRRINPM